MTKIISWNIQCGLGMDGRVDLQRITDTIKAFDDPDIICLQEVSRFDPDSDLGQGADQFAILSSLFPDHTAFFGPAIDRSYQSENNRRQFGNMILSKPPVLQSFNHMLPQPRPDEPCKHMPRQALEVVVQLLDGPLRITTTHLEYHSSKQRYAQSEYLCRVQEEIIQNRDYKQIAPVTGPYAAVARPERSIICGDFNATVEEQTYRLLNSQTHDTAPYYLDAWPHIHRDQKHAPTCGIHDTAQWPEGPHCRDFFFVTPSLVPLLQDIRVNEATDASDHQPVLLELKTQ